MNELCQTKIKEIIDIMENSNEIKEMLELKKKILSDRMLKTNLHKYKHADNPYDAQVITIKKEIIGHPLVQKYRALENNLYFMVLEINRKLESLVLDRKCQK